MKRQSFSSGKWLKANWFHFIYEDQRHMHNKLPATQYTVASVCAWMYFFSVLLPEDHLWKPHRNSTITCHINLYQAYQHSSQQTELLEIDLSGHHTHCILSIQLHLVYVVEHFSFHTEHDQISVGNHMVTALACSAKCTSAWPAKFSNKSRTTSMRLSGGGMSSLTGV